MAHYRTRAQIVIDALRKEVLSGALEPGQDLSHDHLAARYEVSRIPVREALRSLAAEGLIELRPHRAPRVKLHSPEEIAELWWIRQILEPTAARLAAARTTPAFVAATARVLRKIESLGAFPDAGRWLALNRTFHLTMYAAAGKPQLHALITELLDQSARYIGVYLKSPEQFHHADGEHTEMLAAFAAGDADALERLSREHLERVLTALKERFGEIEKGRSD
jgi:DNA-binding GntR family transcriptional regulator